MAQTQDLRCPSGHPYEPGAAFCPTCGCKVEATAGPVHPTGAGSPQVTVAPQGEANSRPVARHCGRGHTYHPRWSFCPYCYPATAEPLPTRGPARGLVGRHPDVQSKSGSRPTLAPPPRRRGPLRATSESLAGIAVLAGLLVGGVAIADAVRTPGPISSSVTPTTAPPSEPSVAYGTAPNWSGYGVLGASFRAARGTFTALALTNEATCDETLSEWVGVGGWGETSLIQAGLVESEMNPTTGECIAGSGKMYLWAFWELAPAPPTYVSSLLVSPAPGDKISVSIQQTSNAVDGPYWLININDNTNGGSTSISARFEGAATSAEWIVEASSSNGVVSQLPPYSSTTFSDLNYHPASSSQHLAIHEISMVQNSDTVSAPTDLDSKGLSDGFTVSYTGP